jgi:transcriptional regulator EpsA
MDVPVPMPDSDPAHFLKIAGQGCGLSSHSDLWRWLQGDVQKWLAHEIMLIGWGDFHSGELYYDVVSSLPGVRSHHCTAASISPWIGYFRDCWAAARHLPCQLDVSGCGGLLGQAGQGWTACRAIAGMRTALVHGMRDGRHRGERVFVALSRQTNVPPGAGTALKLLLPFIDAALRQIAPAPVPQVRYEHLIQTQATRPAALSEREQEIMEWVAMGKTNPEIGCILRISEFTVKNHMKSIFGKLNVTNRAQAVAKLTRISAHA